MNSEIKAFIDALKKLDYFNYATKRWDEASNRFEHDGVQTHWELWCASAQRQGYKLVPVEPTGRMLKHGSCQKLFGGSVLDIYKAMIGAVDE